MTDAAIIARIADKLLEHDEVTRRLGLKIDSVGPGRAVMRMKVAKKHMNALGVCHGGMIATLADTAMALAANSHNFVAMTQHISFDNLAPVQLGETLVATAVEVSREGRGAIYDVEVRSGDALIALARGRTRATSMTHF